MCEPAPHQPRPQSLQRKQTNPRLSGFRPTRVHGQTQPVTSPLSSSCRRASGGVFSNMYSCIFLTTYLKDPSLETTNKHWQRQWNYTMQGGGKGRRSWCSWCRTQHCRPRKSSIPFALSTLMLVLVLVLRLTPGTLSWIERVATAICPSTGSWIERVATAICSSIASAAERKNPSSGARHHAPGPRHARWIGGAATATCPSIASGAERKNESGDARGVWRTTAMWMCSLVGGATASARRCIRSRRRLESHRWPC